MLLPCVRVSSHSYLLQIFLDLLQDLCMTLINKGQGSWDQGSSRVLGNHLCIIISYLWRSISQLAISQWVRLLGIGLLNKSQSIRICGSELWSKQERWNCGHQSGRARERESQQLAAPCIVLTRCLRHENAQQDMEKTDVCPSEYIISCLERSERHEWRSQGNWELPLPGKRSSFRYKCDHGEYISLYFLSILDANPYYCS